MLADPAKTIGYSIRTTGVYDLAVSEVLARLIRPGDTVIDAGANVGYMTLLMAVAAGPTGRVLSFEPHPELFVALKGNVDAARGRHPIAAAELHQAALGERTGTANLVLPADFSANDGVAHIADAPTLGARQLAVNLTTIDDSLGDRTASVLKIDVEGFEEQALRGAARALKSRRIHHVVFEDHDIGRSEVVRLLRDAGYEVFSLGWTLRGLASAPVESGSLAGRYEAPNFVATAEPAEFLARCKPRGWHVLRNLPGRR